MARRQFTVSEVELLIPTLERIFFDVLQLRAALRREEHKLEQAGVEISSEALETSVPGDSPAVKQAKAMFRGYWETLAERLSAIEKLGGEVKDLESALVDFPARREGEDIHLCWKFGEKSLGFWHSPDSGFAGRRPIDDRVPREPRRLD